MDFAAKAEGRHACRRPNAHSSDSRRAAQQELAEPPRGVERGVLRGLPQAPFAIEGPKRHPASHDTLLVEVQQRLALPGGRSASSPDGQKEDLR